MGGGITLREAKELIAARYSEPGRPVTVPEPEPEPEKTMQPVKYNPYRRDGDPSADELRRLSADQLLQLEETEPGISERLQKAVSWDDASSTQHQRDQAARVQAEYDRRLQSDPEFLNSELQARARDQLEAQWDHVTDAERATLAHDAGMDAAELKTMDQKRQSLSEESRLKEAGISDARAFEDFHSGKGALPSEWSQAPAPPDGTDPYTRPS